MDYLKSSLDALRGGQSDADDVETLKSTPNPLTYPKSSEPFSKALFKKPTSEYRGAPFQAWNTKLEKRQLLSQIDDFAEMGMGGFHMHVRTGLDTEYMGDEFMDMIRACVDHAEAKNMLACLYDDDRWPSGSAGGKVIKQYPEHKAKHILFTPHKYGTVPIINNQSSSSARACRSENGHLVAAFDVELDETGCLKSSRVLEENKTGSNVWYVYMETNPNDPWFNDQTYIDTLSPEAMSRFIESTHELYKAKIGDKFGTVVPCIFTDEPQFAIKTQLSDPWARHDVFLPWTPDFPDSFQKEFSEDIVKGLPELIWNLPNGNPSAMRYRYHDHSCERFVSAFMDQLANWCRKNGIMLDGHMMEEPRLHSQTAALGEAMRCYRSMEMPGMDLLCDWVEYNTAKQVTSVARQNGHRGAMTELYGVTHWYFTFEGHKGSGDWQAALGITFRVHHLSWLSMAGEGKRDYPACIGYQSPWYKEYGYVEDHFARVGVAMTRGHAVTRVGVIHPIESYWLAFGPNGAGDERDRREQAFGDLTNWLLHGLIDFDFISESMLPAQNAGKGNGKKLLVGECKYDVVLVPNLGTIRSTTLKILNDFSKAGGKVMILGNSPTFIDAQIPSSKLIFGKAEHIFWGQQTILSALDSYRDIRILTNPGWRTDRLLYQIRQDGQERFVFICNTNRNDPVDTAVYLKHYWKVQKLDTLTGEESSISSDTIDGWTVFPYRFEGCASVLLRLSPASKSSSQSETTLYSQPQESNPEVILENIELSEPNVLLLDFAEFSFGYQPFESSTEVLRIDNIVRGRLSMPRKGQSWKQPWSVPASERASKVQLKLRFSFWSTFDITESTKLALEDAEKITIFVNGVSIPSAKPTGWWVDEAIKTVSIPANTIHRDLNVLEISFPFGILTNIERVYLLGNFAVELTGTRNAMLKPFNIKTLRWGNITEQGLPFYVGNVVYNCKFSLPPKLSEKEKAITTLHVPNFSTPVLAVHNRKNGKKIGRIAFQPHTLLLDDFVSKNEDKEEEVEGKGNYKISITAFGNRYNSFGHIHLPDGVTDQCWPDMWRTEGGWWTDGYSVKPIGVLEQPSLVYETREVIEQVRRPSQEWVLVDRETE